MSDSENVWFKLDNAGKLFPSIATYRCTTVFRVSATLFDMVNVELLQLALNRIISRLPYYQVNLKRGFFWYYLEKTDNLPVVEKESGYPCIYLSFRKSGHFPFRILYFNNRISLEMAHFLTDGTGASIFLKSLLVEYFKLKGIECNGELDGILVPGQDVDKEEYEDAFKKESLESFKKVRRGKSAMHFPFPLTHRGMYHVVTGIMPVKKVIELAKSYGVTLTTFFISLYFEAIFDFIKECPSLTKDLLRPVTMNIPVNLRSIFPSKTMSNFFLSITPLLSAEERELSFEKIMEKVAKQMQDGLDEENLRAYITRNVQGEASIFIRLLPLVLKDALMPLVYLMFGENGYTSSISNIGKITMPNPLNDYIERFEFYPSPSMGNKLKATMSSYKDKLYFSFGKLTKVKIIEKIFFRKLVKMGIPVKIETSF